MTKGEQARLTAWRLRLLREADDERNVARVCRRFGISRKSFYKWKRRHAEHATRDSVGLISPNCVDKQVRDGSKFLAVESQTTWKQSLLKPGLLLKSEFRP